MEWALASLCSLSCGRLCNHQPRQSVPRAQVPPPAACPLSRARLRARLRFLIGYWALARCPVWAAGVAELVDALVLGTSIARCGGSSPFARTSSYPESAAGQVIAALRRSHVEHI